MDMSLSMNEVCGFILYIFFFASYRWCFLPCILPGCWTIVVKVSSALIHIGLVNSQLFRGPCFRVPFHVGMIHM